MKLLIGIPHYGEESLIGLLTSIQKANAIANIELKVLIIDQNRNKLDLDEKFIIDLNIIILRQRPGLSLAKNRILQTSSSDEYIWFIDDDCLVPPHALQTIKLIVERNEDLLGFVFGIGSVERPNQDVLRSWPRKQKFLNLHELFYFGCSINVIFGPSADQTLFDEQLGLGAQFPSCEDKDYLVKRHHKQKFIFTPAIIILHPDEKIYDQSLEKRSAYVQGFGAFCRKNSGY